MNEPVPHSEIIMVGQTAWAASRFANDMSFLADDSLPIGGVLGVLDERRAAHIAYPGRLPP